MATKKKTTKTRVAGSVRVNVYSVMDDAVERGIRYGYMRAHKHTSTPDEDSIVDEINRAVMSELCEILVFHEDEE